MSRNHRIAIVDDEQNIRLSAASILEADDYQVATFEDCESAIKAMLVAPFDTVFIDIKIGAESGLDLFNKMRALDIQSPVIFISGHASLAEVAQSLKLGAYDFIEKPFSAEKLSITLKNCIEFHKISEKYQLLKGENQQSILGEHPSVVQLRDQIIKVAKSEAVVFISGESGTGKELIAENIHTQSQRSKEEFIKVNCSAIPENLIESSFFGHIKGAFTGADKNKKGYFEQANGGTLFLDEIADMPLPAQASLLRVLENKEIQKVGADKPTPVDVRIVAASHKDLSSAVEEGTFRQDLYYRLNVIPLHSPALKDRCSDIPLLMNTFVQRICEKNRFEIPRINPACYPVLQRYTWPGNIRELINIIERMIILGGAELNVSDIPLEIQNQSSPSSAADSRHGEVDTLSWKDYRLTMEKSFLLKHLDFHEGNVSACAKALSMDRSYLDRKLAQLGLKDSE